MTTVPQTSTHAVSASPTFTPSSTDRPTLGPTSSPIPACRHGKGSLNDGEYPGAVVSGPVPYKIYLPDCLAVTPSPMPVLYLFHGKPYDETHWIDLGVIDVYQTGVEKGLWSEAVLVFANLPEPLFSQTDGGPGSMEQEFLNGLLPAIETQFLAGGETGRRAVVGISRGGIWSLEIGLNNPDLAAVVGAFSPSLAVNYPRPQFDPLELARNASNSSKRYFLLAGEGDWARQETERLASVLEQSGQAVELIVVPGEHLDPTWQAGLEPLLEFVLGG